jgi:hypothetical protein
MAWSVSDEKEEWKEGVEELLGLDRALRSSEAAWASLSSRLLRFIPPLLAIVKQPLSHRQHTGRHDKEPIAVQRHHNKDMTIKRS